MTAAAASCRSSNVAFGPTRALTASSIIAAIFNARASTTRTALGFLGMKPRLILARPHRKASGPLSSGSDPPGLGSAPLGLFGLLFYSESADSEGAAPMSGLSAVGMVIGIAIMVAAAIALVVGAVFFIRSAGD